MLFKVRHKENNKVFTVYSVDHKPFREYLNSLTETYFLIFSGTSWRWENSKMYVPLVDE